MDIIRDRDYLRDTDGNYLRVIGDHQPEGTVMSFVKYQPSARGSRFAKGQAFAYNTFPCKSFNLLKRDVDRFAYSKYLGTVVTVTPNDRIVEHYSCRRRIEQIAREPSAFLNHPVGRYIVEFIWQYPGPLSDIGITGSFLFGFQNEKSDIDLVCYGEDAYHRISDLFKDTDLIKPYTGVRANDIFSRRMTHMANVDFESLVTQENRKLQGLINGIHINCQPLRADHDHFMDMEMSVVGEIVCTARVIGDTQGFFAPAYYDIEVDNIIGGLFENDDFRKKIRAMISFNGTYAQSFKKGDMVLLDGSLVQICKGGQYYWGVELSAWNTQRTFGAILLK